LATGSEIQTVSHNRR